MPVDKSKYTHDAYIFKSEGVRRGKRLGYWEKEGFARLEPNDDFSIYLHSTPIGGFDGRIRCRKYGSEAPPEEKDELPQRPAQQKGENDDRDEEPGE